LAAERHLVLHSLHHIGRHLVVPDVRVHHEQQVAGNVRHSPAPSVCKDDVLQCPVRGVKLDVALVQQVACRGAHGQPVHAARIAQYPPQGGVRSQADDVLAGRPPFADDVSRAGRCPHMAKVGERGGVHLCPLAIKEADNGRIGPAT